MSTLNNQSEKNLFNNRVLIASSIPGSEIQNNNYRSLRNLNLSKKYGGAKLERMVWFLLIKKVNSLYFGNT